MVSSNAYFFPEHQTWKISSSLEHTESLCFLYDLGKFKTFYENKILQSWTWGLRCGLSKIFLISWTISIQSQEE